MKRPSIKTGREPWCREVMICLGNSRILVHEGATESSLRGGIPSLLMDFRRGKISWTQSR